MGGWAYHWLYQDFWVLVWPNAGAVPLCALGTLVSTYCFRKPLERAWKRFRAHLHEPVMKEIQALHDKIDALKGDQ